nr:cell division protein FtsB [Candidatus Cloacimonadota bacterium]
MKTKAKATPKYLKYFFYALIILLLVWILFTGRNSFLNTYRLKKQVDRLEQETMRLKVANDSLAQENARLKTDPEAAEKAAREQFGLTKPNEKVFRFVPAREDD